MIEEHILNQALMAGRREYQRVYQLNHDPAVVRLVDAAVEAALEASANLIASETLKKASKAVVTSYDLKGSATRRLVAYELWSQAELLLRKGSI